MLTDLELDVVKKGFEWLSAQQINSVKELSSAVLAHAMWGLPNTYIPQLILEKQNSSWNSSVRDTARACSALSTEGIIFTASERWLLIKKSNGSWNTDVYDTAYALRALADMGAQDREGCQWLYENYCPAWEQVGITSLIIIGLVKQRRLTKKKDLESFIREKAGWVISRKEKDGGWKHISTSNLAVHALILTGFREEVRDSIHWLLNNVRKSGAWGNKEDDTNATALTLGTLGLYKKS